MELTKVDAPHFGYESLNAGLYAVYAGTLHIGFVVHVNGRGWVAADVNGCDAGEYETRREAAEALEGREG